MRRGCVFPLPHLWIHGESFAELVSEARVFWLSKYASRLARPHSNYSGGTAPVSHRASLRLALVVRDLLYPG
jgi:hypothetical protein